MLLVQAVLCELYRHAALSCAARHNTPQVHSVLVL